MWSVGKLQEIKTQKLQWHKEKLMRNEQFVAVKNRDLSKSKKKWIISSVRLKTPLSNIPVLRDVLF